MGLVAGLVSALLGILFAVIFVALLTGQATGTADDRVLLGVLTGAFLVVGALLIVRDLRKHGLRPDFWATVAGVIVGVLGVVGAAVLMTELDIDLEGSSAGKLALLIGVVTGILPGIGVHHLLSRSRDGDGPA